MKSDAETLRVYAEKAADYARMTAGAADDPLLGTFIASLPSGGHVLDLGCGPGLAAAQMAARGLRVTATDAVPQMVAMAARHPGVTARVALFDEIAGDDIYDGIWASFSLLHAPRVAMPCHLAALRRALKPGGLLHVAVKTGSGAERDSLGRLYTYYTADALHALLSDAGFTPFSSHTGADAGLSGEVAPWIAIAAHG